MLELGKDRTPALVYTRRQAVSLTPFGRRAHVKLPGLQVSGRSRGALVSASVRERLPRPSRAVGRALNVPLPNRGSLHPRNQ